MKTTLKVFLTVLLIPVVLLSQQTEARGIEWSGDDDIANAMVWLGLNHLMNIEREKAYTFFDAAVTKDPTLFAPHVALAMLSNGDMRAHHKAEAKKLVEGKMEVSKLYVSLLDITKDTENPGDVWRSTWKKMYELAPDGSLFVNFNYARSRKDVKERIMELEKLAAKIEKSGGNNGHVHNLLGYTYYAEGDKVKAKAHLDKYMELRPNGYNSYDSMAEYYMNEGDMDNALAYYNKALNHYPGAISARNKIEEIEAKKKDKEQMDK
ncbi:MAG: tetratricopeptide repeat protein [Eudoraea sp.]|nr:tetratricopeptide repeat protein [Eudoraea sp.]